MGIRLNWQVESDQVEIKKGEDEALAQRRRVVALRLLLLIGIVIGIAAALVLVVRARLDQADYQIEQLLRSTVDSEVAALRIGDENTFMALQRSATDDWFFLQQANYGAYQSLKLDSDVQFTGRITDLEIVRQRARVHIEEIINGVPYTRIWFYWRYQDGWAHVPPDYTFWGEPGILETDRLVIRYQAVDALFASQLREKLESWLEETCSSVLTCGSLPIMTVDVVLSGESLVKWSDTNAWHLLIRSPYLDQARADMPFDLEYQLELATLLAERLVQHVSNDMLPIYPNDVYYLRQGIISWLIGRFVQLDTNSFLVASLSRNYGEQAVGQLLQLMQPTSDMQVVGMATGVPVEQANLDWRDLITWRLSTEDELIARRDETNWLNLYDTRDETVRVLAYERYNAGFPAENKVAILAEQQTTPDGIHQLIVTVRVGTGNVLRDEIVLFNLVEGVWKRAS